MKSVGACQEHWDWPQSSRLWGGGVCPSGPLGTFSPSTWSRGVSPQAAYEHVPCHDHSPDQSAVPAPQHSYVLAHIPGINGSSSRAWAPGCTDEQPRSAVTGRITPELGEETGCQLSHRGSGGTCPKPVCVRVHTWVRPYVRRTIFARLDTDKNSHSITKQNQSPEALPSNRDTPQSRLLFSSPCRPATMHHCSPCPHGQTQTCSRSVLELVWF